MAAFAPANDGDREPTHRLLLRWAGAAVSVAAIHAGTALAVLNWPPAPIASGEPPAAVMVELAPMPVAPEAPPEDVAVGPQALMAEQSSPSEAKQEPTEEEKPEPKPQLEVPPQDKPQTETPKLEEIPNADAVLQPPAEKPPPEPEEPETKPEPPKPTEAKPSPAQPESSKAAKATTAPKPLPAPKAKASAAPFSGVSSSMSMATWRGMVMAHLHRNKRYSGAGAHGTATVAFTIDRSGRVVSARLIRSSGNGVLDQEAVALARRASPVPAPPANVGGRTVLLTLPLRLR